MTTSTGTLTAQGVILSAMRQIGVMPIGDTPSEQEAVAALGDLNNFLLEIETRGVNLFRRASGYFPLQSGVASYVLSAFPLKIYESRYRNASGIDLPQTELRLTDYLQLPQKNSVGIPTQFAIQTTTTSSTMFVWCVPGIVTTETIQYTYIRRFEVCTALTDALDVAPEWQPALTYGLAKRMMPAYGVDQATAQMVASHADQLLQKAMDFDRPKTVRFRPAYRNMV